MLAMQFLGINMIGDKDPAYATSLTLRREENGCISGSQTYVDDNNLCLHKKQQFFGNKCNHNPLLPKQFIPPKEHKPKPFTIIELTKAFQEAYFKPDDLPHFFRPEGRLLRSEFREMLTLGCAIIAYYYDIQTGELGFHDQRGKWVTLSYQGLANKLNVSLIRIKRFFRALRKRRWITIKPNRKKDAQGNYKSCPANKIINRAFFLETLGIKAWLKIEKFKKWSLKKSKKIKISENCSNVIKSIFKNIPRAKNTTRNEIERKRQLADKAIALYKQNPSRPISEHYKALLGSS